MKAAGWGSQLWGAPAGGTRASALGLRWLRGAPYREPRLLKHLGLAFSRSHLPGSVHRVSGTLPSKNSSLPEKGKVLPSLFPGSVAWFVFALPDSNVCPEHSRADSDESLAPPSALG